MRYPASEKMEIIRTVEGSHLPTKKILDMLGIHGRHFIDGTTAIWKVDLTP